MKKNKIRYIQQNTEYIDILNYVNFWKGKDKIINIIISGPPGIGKTFLAEKVAEELNCSYLDINGHPGLTREDLEGVPEIKQGETGWREGVIPQAINMVNRDGLGFLIINEFNVIRTNVHPSLNSLMDFNGKFCLTTNANLMYEIDEGKTLVIIQTINENLEGTNTIQSSTKTRNVYKINLGYPSNKLEAKVLNMRTKIQTDYAEKICDFAEELRNAVIKEGTLQREVSTRELIHFCKAMRVPGMKLKTAFEYTIANMIAEDPSETKIITDLERGKQLLMKLKDVKFDEEENTNDKKEKTNTSDKREIKEVQEGHVYKVKKLPEKVKYGNRIYEVLEKGKWVPENMWIAKILTKENRLVLYYKPTTGDKKETVTNIKFVIDNDQSLF